MRDSRPSRRFLASCAWIATVALTAAGCGSPDANESPTVSGPEDGGMGEGEASGDAVDRDRADNQDRDEDRAIESGGEDAAAEATRVDADAGSLEGGGEHDV